MIWTQADLDRARRNAPRRKPSWQRRFRRGLRRSLSRGLTWLVTFGRFGGWR